MTSPDLTGIEGNGSSQEPERPVDAPQTAPVGGGGFAVRPIIFSGPMVQALLAGRKTQTRRLASSPLAKCQPGDVLWVREAFTDCSQGECQMAAYMANHPGDPRGLGWRPSIHMPRWASRLTLVVTEVRRQRLQEITLGDICAEGLAASVYDFTPVTAGFAAWAALWDSLHAPPHGWADNPEVVPLTFEVERRNVDAPVVQQAGEVGRADGCSGPGLNPEPGGTHEP